MIYLVGLIIWAFQDSISKEDWEPLHKEFNKVRSYLRTTAPDKDGLQTEKEIYNSGVGMLRLALENYRDYVKEYDFGEI